MARKSVDGIDEPALSGAQAIFGTTSNQDTVNLALREVVRRRLADEFVEDVSARDPVELERLRMEAWQ